VKGRRERKRLEERALAEVTARLTGRAVCPECLMDVVLFTYLEEPETPRFQSHSRHYHTGRICPRSGEPVFVSWYPREPMTWEELVYRVSHKYRIPKPEAKRLLQDVFTTIAHTALHGDDLRIPDFGTFYRATRKARRIVDIRTHKSMEISMRTSVGFRCSKSIKR